MPASEATFIGIAVDDSIANDPEYATKLEEACPVDIYSNVDGHVQIVDDNIDECVLCRLCLDATPEGTVTVTKLYSGETL